MEARVKLCGIAQNEGANLAHWVHHHLRMGFDAVEVWVNGSSDGSVEVMEAIVAARPEVSYRVADALLADSVRRGKYFQYRAYAKMARRARADGFTHAMFLDLDEYWTPADLATSIHAFVPADDEINVVSFPWLLDVPDPVRPPFASPLVPAQSMVMDRHVKSLVRLDDRISKIRPHTSVTSSGSRLLVRGPFPLAGSDPSAQQWGSYVTAEHLDAHAGELPEAFVLHALNRSVPEYVSSLKKAWRRSEGDSLYRTNRDGFLPASGPVLRAAFTPERIADYEASRAQFLSRPGVAEATHASQEWLLQRHAEVVTEVESDPLLLERLARTLRGVPWPGLDAALPGWDTHLELWIDACTVTDDAGDQAGSSPLVPEVRARGWAFSHAGAVEVALRGSDGRLFPGAEVTWSERPDVVGLHPGAPLACGWSVRFPDALVGDRGVKVLVRPVGAPVWTSVDLEQHLKRAGAPDRGAAGGAVGRESSEGVVGARPRRRDLIRSRLRGALGRRNGGSLTRSRG